jgi:hypothetical protein
MPTIPNATVKAGYRSQADDTSIDADVLMFSLLRQCSPIQKAQRVQAIDRKIRQLSPLATDVIEDPICLALTLAYILDRLQISHYVGGSLASSLFGEPRFSEDLDLIIALAPEQSRTFIQAFESSFYVSETALDDALNGRCVSFNVIRTLSGEKVDLFISKPDDFSVSKMLRRISYPISADNSIWICSVEDIILQKLVWGQGSQSEKQWRDVLGVLKVQCNRLDYGYLAQWSDRLGILDALNQAITQAGI